MTGAPPFTAAAWAYAGDVVAGRVLACRLTRLACQRFLDDLAREDFEYVLDAAAAERVCEFVETLHHTKGEWARAGRTIEVERWQAFILVNVFGWVHRETGLRRFRTAYMEVPRKNGKSALSAGVGLYLLLLDGEHGAEVYSGATSLDQAHAVFEPAWLMVDKNQALRDRYSVELGGTKKNPGPIYCASTSSKFEPVIGSPGDGASPSGAIVDEYHEHKTDGLYDTMATGMGAREQPLLWTITTAGSNTSGPCYALHQDVVRMLEGTVPNERLFGLIYTIDGPRKETDPETGEELEVAGDDWTSEVALRKANPNYGVSVKADYLAAQVRDAQSSSRKQGVVKTKHLNVWTTAREGWMNMEKWNACADPDLSEEEFEGEPCWLGMDLASKVDIAAVAKVFKRQIEGPKKPETHYYLFVRSYLPEARVEEPEKRHYQGWVTDGHLTTTDGDVIDHDAIRSDVLDDAEVHRIVTVGFDPYNATQLAVDLSKEGVDVLEVRQTVAYLSEPMKELEAAAISGRLHHTGDPCLGWQVSNVTCRPDANDNVFPRKEAADNKIDGAVAAIIALCVAMRKEDEKKESVYARRGLREL